MKTLRPIAIGALCALTCLAVPTQARAQDLRESHYSTREGDVTVRWGQPAGRPAEPKPGFAQLDADRDGSIDEGEARAYITLANDFDYADHDGNGRVSRREFDRW